MTATDSCLQFDTKQNTWKEVARMNHIRLNAACTVFEGRIVVSGGLKRNVGELKTVEVYDHSSDKWSDMPQMINGRHNHSS